MSIFNQIIKLDARSISEVLHGWWSVPVCLGGIGIAFGVSGAAGNGPMRPNPISSVILMNLN